MASNDRWPLMTKAEILDFLESYLGQEADDFVGIVEAEHTLREEKREAWRNEPMVILGVELEHGAWYDIGERNAHNLYRGMRFAGVALNRPYSYGGDELPAEERHAIFEKWGKTPASGWTKTVQFNPARIQSIVEIEPNARQVEMAAEYDVRQAKMAAAR